MRITRKIAAFLLGVAAWNVITYATFIRNLAKTEGRPTGYYVAHTVLIIVNLGIAAGLGVLGAKAWRAERGRENAPESTTGSQASR
ncbi:SCO4848 family membrane protein [Actinopolymorpha alba]|uniref:SCO4848 family membrane protein n=1 Tax=Actinopolymorpha alba TaxID=533267 RepID=UPI0003664F6F|nr:hypothetical protein [Actinopolymorpha alba]